MRRAFGRVVAMRRELTAVFGHMTADEIAFDARGIQEMQAGDFGHDAPLDAPLQRQDDALVLDDDVAPTLAGAIDQLDGLAADLAHEARVAPAIRLVQGDQTATEVGFEDIGEDQQQTLVVEPVPVGGHRLKRRGATRRTARHEETEHDVAPRHRVEDVAWIAAVAAVNRGAGSPRIRLMKVLCIDRRPIRRRAIGRYPASPFRQGRNGVPEWTKERTGA